MAGILIFGLQKLYVDGRQRIGVVRQMRKRMGVHEEAPSRERVNGRISERPRVGLVVV